MVENINNHYNHTHGCILRLVIILTMAFRKLTPTQAIRVATYFESHLTNDNGKVTLSKYIPTYRIPVPQMANVEYRMLTIAMYFQEKYYTPKYHTVYYVPNCGLNYLFIKG